MVKREEGEYWNWGNLAGIPAQPLLKCVWPWASQLCLSFCAVHSYCVRKGPGTRQGFGSHYCEPDVSHSVYARSFLLQGTEPIQGWVSSFCGESRSLSPSFQWFPFPSAPQFGCIHVGSFKLYSFHIFIWTVRCKKGCWEKTLYTHDLIQLLNNYLLSSYRCQMAYSVLWRSNNIGFLLPSNSCGGGPVFCLYEAQQALVWSCFFNCSKHKWASPPSLSGMTLEVRFSVPLLQVVVQLFLRKHDRGYLGK